MGLIHAVSLPTHTFSSDFPQAICSLSDWMLFTVHSVLYKSHCAWAVLLKNNVMLGICMNTLQWVCEPVFSVAFLSFVLVTNCHSLSSLRNTNDFHQQRVWNEVNVILYYNVCDIKTLLLLHFLRNVFVSFLKNKVIDHISINTEHTYF